MRNNERDVVRIPVVFHILSEQQKLRLANMMLKHQKRKSKIKKRKSLGKYIL